MKKQNNQRVSVSKSLWFYGDLISIVCTIVLGIVGLLVGPGLLGTGSYRSAHPAMAEVIGYIFALVIGLALGLLLGLLIGHFFGSLFRGFSIIVAWYEATPPGCTGIVRPDMNGAAPQDAQHQVPDVPVAHYAPPSPRDEAAVPAGCWKCPSCGAILPGYASLCKRCGADKPKATPGAAPEAPRPSRKKKSDPFATSWICSCGQENPVSRGSCESCGAAKPYPY